MSSFAGDPRIAGRIIRIGSTQIRITGVAPAGSWQLPGSPDAWVLESNAQIQSDAPSTAKGYLLAQLSPRGQAAMSEPSISVSALNPNGIEIAFVLGSISIDTIILKNRPGFLVEAQRL